MYVEITSPLQGAKYTIWSEFLADAGLTPDPCVSQTVLIWEDSRLIATGSRQDNILKCIAIHKDHRGEDLTATILSALRQEAFRAGHRHLFLYTKPENEFMFSFLFFYPVAKSSDVLLMENEKNGVSRFVDKIKPETEYKNCGAVIMNCNPFTLGHRYLIESAAKDCEHLFIFIVSEDKSMFSTDDRINMVKLGTSDIANVTILPTGPYLVSSATFPTYFLKDRDNAENVHCQLDIDIFTKYFVPKFNITKRYVGTEPLSATTDKYNEALKKHLPSHGVELIEIPRLTVDNSVISATSVRKFILAKDINKIIKFVPDTTLEYLKSRDLI